MKKILLLSFFVFFGCSKNTMESATNGTNYLFRELQENNWWIADINVGNISYREGLYVSFSKDYLLKYIYSNDNGGYFCYIAPEGDFSNIEGFNSETERWQLSNKVIKETDDEYVYSIRGNDNEGDTFEIIHSYKITNGKLYYENNANENSQFTLSQGQPNKIDACELDYFGG